MISVGALPIISILIVSAIIIYVVFQSVKLVRESKGSVTVVFFTFSIISYLMSEFYWMAYTFLRPGTRMPFAPNELGEWSAFMLLAAAIGTVFHNRQENARKETVFIIGFVIASALLWMGWSGEIIEDIFCGFAFGYLFVWCVRALKITEAMSAKEWSAMGITLTVLVILQAAVFVVPETPGRWLDAVCYAIMFFIIVYCIKKNTDVFRTGADASAEKRLAVSAGAFIMGTSCMYMSSEPMYFVPELTTAVMMIFMFRSVREVVRGQ